MSLEAGASNEAMVQIHVFANGQADSMLIIGPAPDHRTLLVDAGEPIAGKKDKAQQILQKVQALTGGTHVDYVLTHFHLDHAGHPGNGDCYSKTNLHPTGLFALFDGTYGSFSADTLFDPGDDDQDYIPQNNVVHCGIRADAPKWIQAGNLQQRVVPKLGIGSIDLGQGVSIAVEAVSGRVFDDDPGLMEDLAHSATNPYSGDQPASENDRSIAFELTTGNFRFFSGGDLTGSELGKESQPYDIRTFESETTVYTNVETHLVSQWKRMARATVVDVYRADHHGSGHSSNGDLANALTPSAVIYSAGPNNYGHPDPGVVDEFRRLGARQYVTSGFDQKLWPQGLGPDVNLVAGDIDVEVYPGGDSYSINGEAFKSHSAGPQPMRAAH